MDIFEYLDDKGYEYWTSGKNVSKGWIGLNCFFCNDHSNHLGINLEENRFNCWLCGEHGNIAQFIMSIEDIPYSKARPIADLLREDLGFPQDTYTSKLPPSDLPARPVFPKQSTKTFPKRHIQYLANRNFNPQYLIKKYKLKAVHTVGRYRFRIIVPFFFKHRMVTFTSLDISGKAEAKYLHHPSWESIMSQKEMLYNIDNLKGSKVVIVEGVTDVWRIGDGAVATMGTEIDERQTNFLFKQKEISEAFVIFDSDAIDKGEKFAKQLTMTIPKVELIELDRGDPDTMTLPQLTEVKNFLKI